MSKKLHPVHPGVVLNQEFLKPLSISQNKIARDIKVAPRRINEIVLGKRCLTADTALRLARYFKTSTQFWMNLQSSYDLEIMEQAEDRKDLAVFSKRAKEPTVSYEEMLKKLKAQDKLDVKIVQKRSKTAKFVTNEKLKSYLQKRGIKN